MLTPLLFVMLTTAPDAYGPLVFDGDALYLAHRLVKRDRTAPVDDLMWASTDEALDAQVCDILFEDCSRYLDEFARKAALERHRPELAALRQQSASLKVVAVGGHLCLGEYDFKTKSFPVTGFSLGSPGRAAPSVPGGNYPHGFNPVATKPPKQLRVADQLAAALVRDGRCFDLRAEVVLPTKPVRWPATVTHRNPVARIDFVSPADPPELPVELKRVRLIDANGVDLVAF